MRRKREIIRLFSCLRGLVPHVLYWTKTIFMKYELPPEAGPYRTDATPKPPRAPSKWQDRALAAAGVGAFVGINHFVPQEERPFHSPYPSTTYVDSRYVERPAEDPVEAERVRQYVLARFDAIIKRNEAIEEAGEDAVRRWEAVDGKRLSRGIAEYLEAHPELGTKDFRPETLDRSGERPPLRRQKTPLSPELDRQLRAYYDTVDVLTNPRGAEPHHLYFVERSLIWSDSGEPDGNRARTVAELVRAAHDERHLDDETYEQTIRTLTRSIRECEELAQ